MVIVFSKQVIYKKLKRVIFSALMIFLIPISTPCRSVKLGSVDTVWVKLKIGVTHEVDLSVPCKYITQSEHEIPLEVYICKICKGFEEVDGSREMLIIKTDKQRYFLLEIDQLNYKKPYLIFEVEFYSSYNEKNVFGCIAFTKKGETEEKICEVLETKVLK